MSELQLLPSLILFFSGTVFGVLLILAFNKLKTGSVSANSVKKEKEAYQAEVENHFEETSKKFKMMAEQYQDLYQHLSVGATTLCRPDKMVTGLQDQSALLKIDGEKRQVENTNAAEPESNSDRTKLGSTDAKKDSVERRSKLKEDQSANLDVSETPSKATNDSKKSVSGKEETTADTQKKSASDDDATGIEAKKENSKK